MRSFGSCPVGYREGDTVTLDLDTPDERFRCAGVREALEPFLEAVRQSTAPGPLRFSASCHCPYSKSEVVFYLHASPPLDLPHPGP